MPHFVSSSILEKCVDSALNKLKRDQISSPSVKDLCEAVEYALTAHSIISRKARKRYRHPTKEAIRERLKPCPVLTTSQLHLFSF